MSAPTGQEQRGPSIAAEGGQEKPVKTEGLAETQSLVM